MKGACRRDRAEQRVEFGDWQTPLELALEVVRLVRREMPAPATVIEPTCGEGSFLLAAHSLFPSAKLLGFDVSSAYVASARQRLANTDATVDVGDFFRVKWEQVIGELSEPILLLGNPPWVTNSALGAIEAGNLPKKTNFKKQAGLDAITGKSNFDISEWMLLRLLEVAHTRQFVLAMLCKSSVARRLMETIASRAWRVEGEVRAIDTRRHFDAAVDAVLLRVKGPGKPVAWTGGTRWPVYASLKAKTPSSCMGIIDGTICSDIDAYERTCDLAGTAEIEWRSGIKHDCSKVMELEVTSGGLVNGLGEPVQIERENVFPLLKGSDLANGRVLPRRCVLVTQRRLGEDTRSIQARSPALWQYLQEHRSRLESRKSSIYRDQPPFAIFGVGDYSFAPYKVAICGLYKRLNFVLIRPVDGRPVMVDDTAYFLPCASEDEAAMLTAALNGPRAGDFFRARVFWDAKRPLSKALLQSLSLNALVRAEGYPLPRSIAKPQQQMLGFPASA